MAKTVEVKVPDIGGYDDVPVIEVLVAVGDTVAKDQGLVTLESEKATMEVPSSAAGVVKEVRVQVDDKVSEGTVVAVVEVEGAAEAAKGQPVGAAEAAKTGVAPPRDEERSPSPRPSPAGGRGSTTAGVAAGAAPAAAKSSGRKADITCGLVVRGAGPGGYSAAFRAADLGLRVVLVERYGTLGGVCLNVGCIPSKALLHTAAVMDEALSLAGHGIAFEAPKIDLDALRAYKDGVVAKLTGGLAGMARARKVTVVTGDGQFIDPHSLAVQGTDGNTQTLTFGSAIIAAGSQSVKLPFLPDDPRVVDSTGALLLS